ncbi:MAG: hypothetical protein ACQESN_08800 [Thermotogota bacterium]
MIIKDEILYYIVSDSLIYKEKNEKIPLYRVEEIKKAIDTTIGYAGSIMNKMVEKDILMSIKHGNKKYYRLCDEYINRYFYDFIFKYKDVKK